MLRIILILSLTSSTFAFFRQRCKGRWEPWGEWKGKCEECSGLRVRYRECANSGFFYCGTPSCEGNNIEYDTCGGKRLDGGWTEWSVPDCHYCNQQRIRKRSCTSPAPSCGGAQCEGKDLEVFQCGSTKCPMLTGLVTTTEERACGEKVDVSCPKCYILEGPTQLKCLADGRWHKKLPKCIPMEGIVAQWSAWGPWSGTCKQCNQLIHRVRKCRSSCGEACQGKSREEYTCGAQGCNLSSFSGIDPGLEYNRVATTCGKEVSFSCKNSYTMSGNSQLKCGIMGWDGVLPTCESQTCPPIPTLTNGHVTNTGVTYGKFAHFVCNEGFEIKGQQYLICLGDLWTYEFPTCVSKSQRCPELELKDNVIASTKGTELGSAVEFKCYEGFKLHGASLVTCTDSGLWDNDIPYCRETECDAVPPIQNAFVWGYDTKVGSAVTISCEDGYKLFGSEESVCKDDGQWSEELPTCVSQLCELPAIENGNWYRVKDRNIALLRCTEGYHSTGASELGCGPDGSWEDEPGQCVLKSCVPLPPIEHGIISTTEFDVGTVVSVSCDSGFELAGPRNLECTKDGEWNHLIPICTPTDCNALPVIDHGYISSQNFSQGSVVSIVCDIGYTIRGSNSVRCQENTGEWYPELPICILSACVSPYLKNGTITNELISLGGHSKAVCDTGFTLLGSERVYCSRNGITKLGTTTCVPITCPVFNIHNASILINDVTVGSDAVVKCDEGFLLTSVKSPLCTEDGTWDEVPSCNPVRCPTLELDGQDGEWEVEGYSIGNSATVSCDIWYEVAGPALAMCLPSGNWSITSSSCKRIACPLLVDPMNGVFVKLSEERAVSLRCEDGYKVKGPDVLSCSPEGQWNDSIPICALDIHCPVLKAPIASWLSTNDTEYGTKVSLTCDSERELTGHHTIYCTANGTWNSTLASCAYPDCPDISERGVIITGTSVGSTATLGCDECQYVSGNTTSTCVEGGVWSPAIGQCNQVICDTKINRDLYESVEGEVPTTCGNSVTFACKKGYTTIGRTTITCYDTGQYDFHVPFCVESGIFRLRRIK